MGTACHNAECSLIISKFSISHFLIKRSEVAAEVQGEQTNSKLHCPLKGAHNLLEKTIAYFALLSRPGGVNESPSC